VPESEAASRFVHIDKLHSFGGSKIFESVIAASGGKNSCEITCAVQGGEQEHTLRGGGEGSHP
jgi:hypothetical protein